MTPAADKELTYQRLAEHAGLPFASLDPGQGGTDPVDPAAAALLDPETARAFGMLPLVRRGTALTVAMSDPHDEEALAAARTLTGLQIRPIVTSPASLERAQRRHYGPSGVPDAASWAEPEQPPAASRAWHREPLRYVELARHANLDFVSLAPTADGRDPVDYDVARLLPEEVCRRFLILPLSVSNGVIQMATADPFDEVALRAAAAVTGYTPQVAVGAPLAIEAAVERVFARRVFDDYPDEIDAADPVGDELEAGDALEGELARRRPLGELLVARGVISSEQLDEALELQERYGDRLGEVLMNNGVVREEDVYEVLAEQLQVGFTDQSSPKPDPEALALVPEYVARQHRLVPLAIVGDALYVAMTDAVNEDAVAAISEHTSLRIRPFVASDTVVDRLLQELYSEDYVRSASRHLLMRAPEESAHYVLSRGQRMFLVGLFVTLGGLVALRPMGTLIALNVLAIVFYTTFALYRIALIYQSLSHELELPVSDEELAALDERTLPVYTLLVPLYGEGRVVERLVSDIAALDYPVTKLDIKLLLEEDDDETIEAVRRLTLPPQFKQVLVPNMHPRTKPKACNYGLTLGRGKYVVIYDAEDRPDPDQLKKAVVAFRKSSEHVACLQCKLNYYNREQNLLTRWFTTEYAMWFDLFMPGLDRSDCPIPLGGTSNHFRTDRLIELGAWDPFNVTEDADLGLRLHKAGYKTAILDSTTYEEANSDLFNWIRQRSRWVKGYIQSWLVQMRHPLLLLRQLGLRRWVSFQYVVGGTFLLLLINPVYWLLTTLWVLTEAGVIREIFPGLVYYAAAFGLHIGNFTFAYMTAAGASRRGYDSLVKYALLSPLYWGLMSIGAWKGFLQLFTRPFYWEKTVHGLDSERA